MQPRAHIAWVVLLLALGLILAAMWWWKRPAPHVAPTADDLAIAQRDHSLKYRHAAANAVQALGEGLLIAGETGGTDVPYRAWILSLGHDGDLLWQVTLKSGLASHARALALLPPDQVLVAGEIQVSPQAFQGQLARMTVLGQLIDERSLGAPGNTGLEALAVRAERAMAVGIQDGTAWLLELGAQPGLTVSRSLDGVQHARSIIAHADGYVMGVTSGSLQTGRARSAVIAIGADGKQRWRWDTPSEEQIELATLCASDDQIIVAGTRIRAGAARWNVWLGGLDDHGVRRWETTLEQEQDVVARAISCTTNDQALVLGSALGANGKRYTELYRVSATGKRVWQRSYGAIHGGDGRALLSFEGGSSIVAGSAPLESETGTQLWVMRLNRDGDVLWEKRIAGPKE